MKEKQMEQLLERFFEGSTSNREERQLYDFFAGRDVPEHLLPYKPLFACFEALPEAFCEKESPVRRKRRVKWMLWPCAAAALLALVLLNPFGYGNKPRDPYEGSYIVCNGVRITDLDIIRPELEAAVREVLQLQEEAERLIAEILETENYFQAMEDCMRAQHDAILEHFQDEEIREKVRKMPEEE
ncbi:MAG: hypothetical protein LBL57_08880 [Tannerella sp.]|jgi:hypothetical protein|nr:hypothetical protein [Tannerella sp.]